MADASLSGRISTSGRAAGSTPLARPMELANAPVPSVTGGWSLAGKYRLTLIFSISALIVILAAAFLISYLVGRTAEHNMIRVSERSVASDMVSILASIENQNGEPLTLQSVVDFDGLPMKLPALAADYSLVRLQVYDPQGNTVWSTDRGSEKWHDPGDAPFAESLQGNTASRFLPDRKLADLGGVRPHLAVVETYLPLRDTSSGEVVGVLEIQRNVTDDVPFLIGATRTSVMKVTGATMAGLFIVLLAVVVVADVAISRSKRREQRVLEDQLAERHQAAEALLGSNQKLQEVVETLKDTQQQILQQERLKALGQMASGITHDFNNALTPILGFASLLINHPEKLDDRESLQAQLRFINTAAEDAAAVVSRLREFYRKREGVEEFVSIDLVEVADLAVTLTQAKWRSQAQAQGITINLETDLLEVPQVIGNASELREALINLIFNAVDAMPQGGTLTLSTRQEGGYVALRIGDTGTGMTDDVRSRCLDPFFTTKGTHGTGMGLSMVYGIMQRHEGIMDIESQLGQGTTFVLRLPVQKEPVHQEVQAPDAAGPGQSLNILAVDDEPMIRQLISEFLRMDGHRVETAENGADGAAKFSEGHYDLVITDRAMPDMSGDQLAAVIKAESPATPVILLTGFGDIMAAANENPESVDLILGKPLTLKDLRQALEAVMLRSTPTEEGINPDGSESNRALAPV